jgi:cellulose synthase/poly-beta-1,6-N-acetylglucosamine synthase-like glycosyltransferase
MIVFLVRHYVFTLTVLKNAKKGKPFEPETAGYEPTVSILVPARNEKHVIGRLLQRLGELTYPKSKLQVIVVDDASSDCTGEIADAFAHNSGFIEALHRDRLSGGKGKNAAMNAAFQRTTGEIVLCFDADYYPQEDIVQKLTRPFRDPKVGAVQGRVVVLNEPQNVVTRLVALERIGGYRVDQEARDSLGLITQFGGTVGGFRRSLLTDLGGWDEHILAEDTDLTYRVYLAGFCVRYVVDAECYEEAVDNWHAYWTQRYRWARGHMQCFFKHFSNVATSKRLSFAAKIDGLLLLGVYFMPLIVLLSLIIGLPLIFLYSSRVASLLWFFIPLAAYSFVGNFAPFFEVGVGAHLDGRQRIQWLIPLLMFTFLYNIPICAKAFGDLVVSRVLGRKHVGWAKTTHFGSGNYGCMSATKASVEMEGSE